MGVYKTIDYMMRCNGCSKCLAHTKEGVHQFHPIREGSREHIKEVAENMEWDSEKCLCPKCKIEKI